MADEKEAKEMREEKKSPQGKKAVVKFIILGAVIVALVGGAYVGWNSLIKKSGNEKSQFKAEINEDKGEVKVTHSLDQFIVNLNDKGSMNKRYLKIKMELEVENQKTSEVIGKRTAEIRDTIILLLSNLGIDEISSMDGKIELKQAILSRINQVLGKAIVNRVYFSDFVVQ